MKYSTLLLVCLLGGASAARLGSPVERVVKLLEDLKSTIAADTESETQTYNKFACWCKTTSERKAGLVVTGGDDLRSLGQQILKGKGQVATLTAEVAELTQKIKESLEQQESLTSIRSKQNAAYQGESSETKEALSALATAIKVLAAATTPGAKAADALLQEDSGLMSQNAVKAALTALPTSANIAPKHMSALSEFTTLKGKQRYSPQSATIQGILGDMYTTMSADLESSTQTEGTRNTDFEKTISSMEQSVIDMTKSKESKEDKKANAESLLADNSAAYDDTEAQMHADTAFFDTTKDACNAKSDEWNTRSKLRTQEVEGIDVALKLLTSDEAKELFATSIKPGVEKSASFLQVSSEDSKSPAFKAYAAIRSQARKSKSLRLASLAATVRLAKVGHFDKVLAAIDGMVNTLKDEGAADLAKRDQCNTQYQENALKVGDLSWQVEKNEAAIDKLAKLIEMRSDEKATTIGDIKSVDDEMAAMLQQRTDENKAFKQARKDDMAAIALINQAKDAVTAYFSKNDVKLGPIQGSVKLFEQEPVFEKSKDQAPDAKFSGKDSNKNASKAVISALQSIVDDLENEVNNGVTSEVNQQIEYEKALATAQNLRKELVEKKVNLETAIAKRNKEKTDENKDKDSNNKDKDAEVKYKSEIKPDCDWIIANFKVRADGRAAEINGLEGAKEFLAGKAPEGLIQQKETFDDDVLPSVKFLGMKA